MCVPLTKVCDGRIDCPNGEDEPKAGCGVNECAVNNGNCSHACIDLPLSYRCDCESGYQLVGNYTCEGMYSCRLLVPTL